MSQLFQRRPSEQDLFINPTVNMKKVSSFGKDDILKAQSSAISYLISATDESEDDRGNQTDTGRDEETNQEDYDDSGHEDDEDLVASEEILLPEDDEDEEEEETDDLEEEESEEDDESKIFKRQMAYPPLPQYLPPDSQNESDDPGAPVTPSQKAVPSKLTTTPTQPSKVNRRPTNPRERIGVLTPMEEVTEPPSSAGTEASGVHQSRRRKRNPVPPPSSGDNSTVSGDNSASDNGAGGVRRIRGGGSGAKIRPKTDQKSILKSNSPEAGSPERRVKFVGAGSITASERGQSPVNSVTSEYSSMVDSGRKNETGGGNSSINGGAIPEETEDEEYESSSNNNNFTMKNSNNGNHSKGGGNMGLGALGNLGPNKSPSGTTGLEEPVMEIVEKVQTWQLGSASSGDETPPSALDTEFPSILDDIIAELHSWDRLTGTGPGATEVNASRQDHLANVSSQLASYLSQISAPTVMRNLPQIIPLVTTLVSVTEMNFRAQLTSLNAVNVLIDRLKDCKAHSGLKVLPNADLTWLFRTLCDLASESSRSVLKSEGTSALAKLVKAGGPEMISEPLMFILMGNDEPIRKSCRQRREGSGNIVATGVPGGAPKIKATALDTLTFALLTFPRDDFDLDLVAKLACHCLLHSKRRVRQAALECLAVVSHSMGPNQALPMFRKFILEEEEGVQPEGVHNGLDNVNASNSSISTETSSGTGSGSSISISGGAPEPKELNPLHHIIIGPPSRIPVPIRLLQANHPTTHQHVPTEPHPPTSPVKASRGPGDPTPSSAVRARISRHVLPSPSLEELVEYAVKIPAKCAVSNRQSVKTGSRNSSNSTEESTGGGSYSGSASVNSGSERLSSSGDSNSSGCNIDYSLLELDPVLNAHGSGVGQRKRGAGGTVGGGSGTGDLVLAPDILWILNGSGPVKKYDPASRFPKERNEVRSLNRINSLQYPGTITNSSGPESDFSSSSRSPQRIVKSSSDFDMRRFNRAEVQLQDSLASQDPVLGRYYYPPPGHQHASPRGPLNSSDSSRSRLSSSSTFGLLPNKYSIMKNSVPNLHHPLSHHDMMAHHNTLLPGAYDNPFGPPGELNTYGSNWSNGHSEYVTYSSRMSRPMPLQPISSLREKFFDSSRRNGGFDGQNQGVRSSESPTTEEEDSGSEKEEKTEQELERNGNEGSSEVNKNGTRKAAKNNKIQQNGQSTRNENGNEAELIGPKSVLINKVNSELTSMEKKGEEFAKGVNRDFQVYHHRIEVEPTGPAAAALAASMSTKRGDVDSAGSNNTRDSGVSLGSQPGSKSPPSAQTTPPSQHRSSGMDNSSRTQGVSASQRSSKGKGVGSRKAQLNRNWQSTPDVPTASDTEDGESAFGNSRRNLSGSPSQFHDQRLQNRQLQQAQGSSSEGVMLVHRKPVLARRGESVGRIEIDDLDSVAIMPQIRYPVAGYHLSNSTVDRQTSGRNQLPQQALLDVNYESPSPFAKSAKIRHSVSTGNLINEEEERNGSLSSSKSRSTYLEITDEAEQGPVHISSGSNYNNRRSRLAQKNNGPFGEVRATPEDFSLVKKSGSQTLPRKTNANGVPKVSPKIVPTKVYKGSFRDMSRKGSNGSNNGEVFPLDLKPVTSPKHALPAALQQLQSNEWETNVDGFRQIVRMIRYNPETIRADLHNVNMSGVRHLSNLRSQVCRSAILCFREMFMQLGKSMEADSEKIAEKLLDKSADTNKFIREDSGKTLDAMVENLTPTKGLACLDLFGTRHRNPAVRCMAAKMTTKLVQNLGPERCLTELPERLLPMLCKLLQEGGLETRTTAKSAISTLMTHPSFYTQLKRYVPSDVLRHAQKSIDSLQK